jgi:hypothetical protein
MRPLLMMLILLSMSFSTFSQSFQNTLSLFSKKTLPYSAPSETYTNMYLEEGEESLIPYNVLLNEQLAVISGNDYCKCEAFAVDYLELPNGYKGLVTYQINIVEVMPYEELTYHLYIVDETGKSMNDMVLNSEFFTSDPLGDIFMSDEIKSTIYFGEYDEIKDRLFIKTSYRTEESIQSDFGQVKTLVSTEFSEILESGEIVNITVYLEE